MAALKFIGIFLLGALTVGLALIFYRLPQAALTWIFPNDYVYRFSLSVTLDGKTYTGETVSGCRVQRSPVADALEDTFGSRWRYWVWATPLNVALPDGRFLYLEPRAYCSESPERPDPAWKRRLGLLSLAVADKTPLDPFRHSRPILFDDPVAPKQGTVLLTRAGAESLRLQLSSVTVKPATWREVEENLARKPGAPWLAPIVEQCVRTRSPRCRIDEAVGFKGLRLTLAEAMEFPAFADWARQVDRSQPVTMVPDWVIGSGLIGRFREKKPIVAMTPDWSAGRWIATEQHGLAHVVTRREWSGDLAHPILCFAADRCAPPPRGTGFGGFGVVDWNADQVIAVEYQPSLGPIVFNGERR
jgi:hypothetical protein